jgi:hypothetical protein
MANKQTKEQSAMEVSNQESVTTTTDTATESPKTHDKKLRSFADVNEKIEFYPELDKVDFEAVKGIELTIIDAKLIRDFDSKFGKHDFMIVHASDGKSEFTFGTSGQVLIKRIMDAQERRKLPLTGTINKPEGKAYYDIN